MSNYAPYMPNKRLNRRNVEQFDDFPSVNTPELKRIGGDWLRINDGGNGQTALYGNLSVNDGGAAGGLTVGDWKAAGQGNIVATEGITVKGRDLLAELDAIKAKIGM
jgi:hypothetical protein